MARVGRGRPRSEPRDEQRRRILHAARAAFTELGYDRVSLADIARRAGVARPVVYEVVGRKDEVLGAVADDVAEELLAATDERLARDEVDRPLDTTVLDQVRWFVDLIASDPSYAAIIRLSGRLDPGHDPAGGARRRFEQRLAELHVERAASFGLRRPATAALLSGAVINLVERAAVGTADDAWSTDAVASLVAEFIVGGYLRVESGGAAQAFEDAVDRSPTSPERPDS